MKCDRCNTFHWRTFKCYNENIKAEENICGYCIIEIWGITKLDVSEFYERMRRMSEPMDESSVRGKSDE